MNCLPLKIFNTLGRKIETFCPIDPANVRIYTCGPTVYDYGHIGNFRTFVSQDILRRYLEYKGFKVTQVMNITDVDDKTIRGSVSAGESLSDYTKKYTKTFFDDLKTLNIERAEYYPKATEHINEMVTLIKKLVNRGYAYESGGSYYYDVSKFAEYGNLSGIKLVHEKDRKARVKEDEYKDEASDFALWKAYDKDDGEVFWDTELGKGRPGWHIECSAMSCKYLGESFDIHAGGVDLIFPHHENEISQSEGANDKKFVNYWFHSEHLLIEGQKMSKSLGNILTVRDFLRKGYSGLTIRYLLLSAQYRTQLNFSESGLRQAQASVQRINDFNRRLKTMKEDGKFNKEISSSCLEVLTQFEAAMDKDLNISEGLAALFDFIKEINKSIETGGASRENIENTINTLNKINKVLGILETDDDKISEEIKELIESREAARRKHDWKTTDSIREELLLKGIILEDTPEGVKWKRRN